MTVQEAIAAAESILPGQAALEGEIDTRWQAIIAIGDFIEAEPEAVWSFVRQWGTSPDEDLRMAIATCLLEHLLEHDFDAFMPRVEAAARADPIFGDVASCCWINVSEDRRERFARLTTSRQHDRR